MYGGVLCSPLQLDSWSVGALAYDVLCGRAPFAAHEDSPREEEKHAILNEVGAGVGQQQPAAGSNTAAPTITQGLGR